MLLVVEKPVGPNGLQLLEKKIRQIELADRRWSLPIIRLGLGIDLAISEEAVADVLLDCFHMQTIFPLEKKEMSKNEKELAN
jgi:hypothetical protein